MARREQPRTRRRVREEGYLLSDRSAVNSSIFERGYTEEIGLRDILFKDLKFERNPVETEELSNLPNHQSKKIKTEFDSRAKRSAGDLIRNSVLLDGVKPEPVEQKVVIHHYEEIILSDSSSDTDGQNEHEVEKLDIFDKSFEIIDYSQLDTTEVSQLITNPSDGQKIKQETEIKLEHNAFANTGKESVLSDADEKVDAVNSDDLGDKVPNFTTNNDKVTESSQSYSHTEDCEDNEQVKRAEKSESEDISVPVNIFLNDLFPEKEDGEILEPDCNKTILIPPAKNINSTGRLNKSSFSIIREWLANQDKSDSDSQVTFGIKTSQHFFKREGDKSRNMETSSTDSAKDRSNNSKPSRVDSRSQEKKSHDFKRSPSNSRSNSKRSHKSKRNRSNSRSRNRRSHKSKRNHSHSRSKKSKSPDSNTSHSNSRSRDRRSDRKPNRFTSRNTNKRSNSKTRLSDFERNSKQSCTISGSPDIKPPNLNTSSISRSNDKAYKTQMSGEPLNSQTSITLDNASKASTSKPTTLKLENTTSPLNTSPEIFSMKAEPEIHDTYINQQQFSTIDVSDGETVILDDFSTINTSKKRRRRSAEDIQIIEERSPSSITRNENRSVSSTTLKERMRSLPQTDVIIRPKLSHKDLGTQVLVFDPTTDPVTYHEGQVTGIVDGTRVQVTRYDGQITDVDVFTSNNFNAVVQNVVPTKPGNVSIF